MICVLDVTAGPARGRRFWLRNNQQVEIGRISSADFSVPADSHMSRRHLILEGTVSAFRLRDVGSANGTFVNNAKVSAVELCSGDRIRAGETTFEVSVVDDDENPHAKDGFTFSSPTNSLAQPRLPVRSIVVQAAANCAEATELEPTDYEATRRCQVPNNLGAELDCQPAGSGTHSNRKMEAGTVLANGAWWTDYGFEFSDFSCLLDQADGRLDGPSVISALVKHCELDYALTAIVNVERLGRFGRQLLGALVERGGVTWHSAIVCTILNDRSRDFLRLVESALTLDALIVLGSREVPSSSWLAEITVTIIKPSILNRMLRDSISPRPNSLLSAIDLAIFEHDRQGRLSLLLRHPAVGS